MRLAIENVLYSEKSFVLIFSPWYYIVLGCVAVGVGHIFKLVSKDRPQTGQTGLKLHRQGKISK